MTDDGYFVSPERGGLANPTGLEVMGGSLVAKTPWQLARIGSTVGGASPKDDGYLMHCPLAGDERDVEPQDQVK